MANKITKQPEIRFKEFNNDWEQRKLGEEVESIGTGKSKFITGKKKSLENPYPVLGSTSVISYDAEFDNSGDFILTARVGANAGNLYTYSGNVKISDNTVYIKSKNLYFIYYLLLKFNLKQLAFGTGQPLVKSSELKQLRLMFSNGIKEQQKIGSFFKQLDDTIALQDCKLEEMQLYKKAMLQKMFPKNGEKAPEIRFDGYNDDWEQRKLKDVSERVRGNDGRMDLPTLTISAGSGWLDQRERFSGNIAGKEQKNYTLLSKGEISYNHGNSKLAKYGAVFVLRTFEEALVPRVYHSFKTNEKASADFIEYMFATKIPDRELGKLISSGARMDGLLNINYDDFMGIKINIPSIEEQERISAFLRQLDDTIALQNNKLNKLKEMKKALLQKMFV
ncbi:restriction endonuclease subunit S [Vagococcus fluvialis]|uniref:restriction endonuclease subunit S n=2 Tax=Vagococcus fluvialis TaxID=2738 RepID=UPI003B5C6F89